MILTTDDIAAMVDDAKEVLRGNRDTEYYALGSAYHVQALADEVAVACERAQRYRDALAQIIGLHSGVASRIAAEALEIDARQAIGDALNNKWEPKL